MLSPSRLGAQLDRVLPQSLKVPLHHLYEPYFRWAASRTNRRLLGQLFSGTEVRVQAGPFSGMKYLSTSRGSALVPKIIGAYELELHPAFEQVIRRDYRTVVDIGCAEGYYAVGLALRLPQAIVHGFDLDPEALAGCRRLAEINGVASRLRLAGRATLGNLASLVGSETLIISDCEGAEVELLDPGCVPGLRQADVIVELHDCFVPGASKIIAERFSPTHHVRLIGSQERDPAAFPVLRGLDPEDQHRALDEFRGGRPMQWGFLDTQP
jgi:hypothetical protein